MYYQQDWYTSFYQLQQQMRAQANQIMELQKIISNLQTELEQVKKNPSMNVEKIEYKFDQLKIETLEGTLNIGLNPNDLSSIEDFAIQQDGMNIYQPIQNKQEYEQIYHKITRYLDEECLTKIKALEQEHMQSHDDTYYYHMIDDLKNQISHRITYYMNQFENKRKSNEEDFQSIIIQKVKDDIDRSFLAFIENYANNSKGAN